MAGPALRARISEAKFRDLARFFALDLEAGKIAALTRLNRNTIFKGEVEVDESYFGARRVKGKRGRGAYGETPVFGVLRRGGRVDTEIVPDRAKATPQAIIRGRVAPKSVIHSDGWRGCNASVDLGYKKHCRGRHGQDQFAKGRNHINGIEPFRSFAKARLMKFNGLPSSAFYLHLKESESRFNYRGQDLYAVLLKMLREKPFN